jgi:hypothetical protein
MQGVLGLLRSLHAYVRLPLTGASICEAIAALISLEESGTLMEGGAEDAASAAVEGARLLPPAGRAAVSAGCMLRNTLALSYTLRTSFSMGFPMSITNARPTL